jgi:hypothetical protein
MTPAVSPSFVARDRVTYLRNSLGWCYADKALGAIVVLRFAIWHVGLQYYYLRHPSYGRTAGW